MSLIGVVVKLNLVQVTPSSHDHLHRGGRRGEGGEGREERGGRRGEGGMYDTCVYQHTHMEIVCYALCALYTL